MTNSSGRGGESLTVHARVLLLLPAHAFFECQRSRWDNSLAGEYHLLCYQCFFSKVSPDGASAYLACLDNSETNVHIQMVNPTTFIAVGPTVTVTGAKEGACLPFQLWSQVKLSYFAAGGLVVQNDSFALLTNLPVTGVSNAPPGNTPVPVIVRYNISNVWLIYIALHSTP